MAFIEYERLEQGIQTSSSHGTVLPIVEESNATAEVAALYQHFKTHFGRADVPGILKCFATHPPLLRHMMALSESIVFSDGALVRRHKEMIATLVSTQNSCSYCADSHGYYLRVHGGSAAALHAIEENQLASPALTSAEQILLRFAEKVNRASQSVEPTDVAPLTLAGWNELQIAEAIHIVALFSAFNRVANAFGLQPQGLLALYARNAAPGQL